MTFADVAGVEEAKTELTEVVEFLSSPERFRKLGARIPKGVLMVGAPGSGKTLLARAVAGEAGVPFFSISGSESVEMFVGVGASRGCATCSTGPRRPAPASCSWMRSTRSAASAAPAWAAAMTSASRRLNQLLVEMDGFDTNTHVIVIAATSRPDVLDPALLRPGRFNRRVVLDRPDVRGRRAILDVHARNKPLAANVDLDMLARQTPGFCGAELANVVNEAAILAARAGHDTISTRRCRAATGCIVSRSSREAPHWAGR